MYVHIFGFLVNKLEIRCEYRSPIEKKIIKNCSASKAISACIDEIPLKLCNLG